MISQHAVRLRFNFGRTFRRDIFQLLIKVISERDKAYEISGTVWSVVAINSDATPCIVVAPQGNVSNASKKLSSFYVKGPRPHRMYSGKERSTLVTTWNSSRSVGRLRVPYSWSYSRTQRIPCYFPVQLINLKVRSPYTRVWYNRKHIF